MVLKRLALGVWIGFVAGAAPLHAAGVIYKLPQDGAWVRFEGELVDESPAGRQSSSVVITIRSVGQATVAGKLYRWIEMRSEFPENGSKKPINIVKGLFPAEQLKLGGDPVKGLLRAWRKTGDAAPVEVPEAQRADQFGMHERFVMLLWGPLEDVKKLDKRVVDSGLGKLECEGLVGHVRTRHDGIDIHLKYGLRLHEQAPFGVVAFEFRFEALRGGKALATGTMNLKLAASGTGAKSALPVQE